MRKPPLSEAQTALGKQKIRSLEHGYFPLRKFCEKLISHAKFHWNRAIDCWVMAKKDFQYGGRPPFWILNIFIFGQWLSSSSKAAVVYHISQKSDNFVADIMGGVHHVEFSKFKVCHVASTVMLFGFPMCKISLKLGNRLPSYDQKWFLIWRPSAILNSKIFHIWPRDCHWVPNLMLCTKFNQNRMISR